MSKPLSPREKEVVRLTTLGCTNAEIGAILGMAANTADTIKRNAMVKLDCNKAVLLTRLALKMKITALSDELTAAERRKAGWE